MHQKLLTCVLVLICGSLSLMGQTAVDSTITIVKEIEEVEILQQRTPAFVHQEGSKLVIAPEQLKNMPKFLGTSDPIRFMQSLSGIQTNNETTTGIHIQGCDDYQSLVSINGAPVFYPNHLLGLYSTFITPHFQSIAIEQAEHTGTMANRIGGEVAFETQSEIPYRFSFEGNIGIVNSDITFHIPVAKRHALFVSARTSYIDWLYGRLLNVDDYAIRYHFQDYNLTYSGQLSDKDQLVLTGFYSRDKATVAQDSSLQVPIHWQNIAASASWTHQLTHGEWKSTAYYSSYDNALNVSMPNIKVAIDGLFSSCGLKNHLSYGLIENIDLSASLDYEHYINRPMKFQLTGITMYETDSTVQKTQHGDELSGGVDIQHRVCTWFDYNAGLHLTAYIHEKKFFGAIDPRITLRFHPAPDHSISLHYGMYHQYFHKTGLTSGGLPTDFFFLSSSSFLPEWSHAVNLRYSAHFLNKQYNLTTSLYFKQVYNIVASTSNVLQLLNEAFSPEKFVMHGDGRQYGWNLMFQRSRGIVTGYVSYTLGWALRRLPELEGRNDYIYSASHERRHDLKVVLNSQLGKRWNIGAMFVLATGLPYTEAKEAYLVNGSMICHYGPYNGAHIPLYHRLDLSVSCDIIKKKGHELGINVSLYNVYAHRNAQFVTYREDLRPMYGSSLSTIIPSISLYGKF